MKKRCSKCKKEKDASEFIKNSRVKSGLYGACRKCHYKICRKWTTKNRIYVNLYNKKWHRKQRKENPKYRLDSNIGSTIGHILKSKKSWRKWENLVGYKLEDLMKHLEGKFDGKMTWDNYGNYWEVDHIKPKSLFKYETAEDPEFKKCWALENLQPMEKLANRYKRNKFQLKR